MSFWKAQFYGLTKRPGLGLPICFQKFTYLVSGNRIEIFKNFYFDVILGLPNT